MLACALNSRACAAMHNMGRQTIVISPFGRWPRRLGNGSLLGSAFVCAEPDFILSPANVSQEGACEDEVCNLKRNLQTTIPENSSFKEPYQCADAIIM